VTHSSFAGSSSSLCVSEENFGVGNWWKMTLIPFGGDSELEDGCPVGSETSRSFRACEVAFDVAGSSSSSSLSGENVGLGNFSNLTLLALDSGGEVEDGCSMCSEA
jgi:hypothetical protein